MADFQRVSCTRMKQDCDELADSLKEIPEAIRALQEAMHSLAACWEGPAWSAFQQQVAQDLAEMQDVYSATVKLQNSLGGASEIYQKTEYDVYKKFHSLRV